jgi:hypothetical protein
VENIMRPWTALMISPHLLVDTSIVNNFSNATQKNEKALSYDEIV